jgi:hypothetical protein
VLVIEEGGNVYALANKCVHMGLPLQGKTAMFQCKVRHRWRWEPALLSCCLGSRVPHGPPRAGLA